MKIVCHGEYMPVSDDGLITRQGALSFSGDWLLLGAERYNNFGKRVDFIPFGPHLADLDWRYKNGKQRWHVVDLDHGTRRTWMGAHIIIHG